MGDQRIGREQSADPTTDDDNFEPPLCHGHAVCLERDATLRNVRNDVTSLAKINADVNEALRQSELLTKLSAEIFGGSLERTADYMRHEAERWRTVIKSANIQMQYKSEREHADEKNCRAARRQAPAG
jgi:hypothetical protein